MSSSITRTHTTARMSKIVRHGDLVYLCGQTSGGTDIADVAGQTSEVLRRIDGLLKEAGTADPSAQHQRLRRDECGLGCLAA